MLNDRVERIGDYPFDRLRALLAPLSPPDGLAPILLQLGEPKHAPPALIRETVDANAAGWGRYPPMAGTPDFRAAAAQWLIRRYRLPHGMVDADRQIIPVSGTREALFLIALTAVPETKGGRQPAVLMPNPFYQVYAGAAVLSGAEAVYVPAERETGFLPDYAALDAALLARTALAYYCSPANPQGTVAPLETLVALVRLAREHDFLIVFDECYSEIYDRDPPPGGMEACAALGGGMENVLVFQSLSKRSSAPGLRSGFVAGHADLIRRFTRLRDYGGAAPPLPLLAAAAALWRDESHVELNREMYRRKFDLATSALSDKFGFYRPGGGFYLWLDVGDGEAAAQRLWADAAVRVLPGAYLAATDAKGHNPGASYIRCALVDDDRTTEAALDRIARTL
ncbi:MAG: aminotransferase class I/II-fold pyridoxal phosphate-dependent enzyme [Alphaproteobacteria bacterium]